MVTIPGASGFLNAATLANSQGVSAQSATILGNGGIGGVDILDVARANAPDSGVGLSSRARLLNNEFLSSTASTFNEIFSLGLGATASIDGLQQQILALRGSIPDSGLSREVLALSDVEVDDAAVDAADPEVSAADAEVAAIRQALTDRVQTTLSSLNSFNSVDTEA